MKLFSKPAWLKPEINEPKYWLHLLVLSFVVLSGLQYFFGGDMLSVKNVLTSVPFLAVGDLVAHTLLQID